MMRSHQYLQAESTSIHRSGYLSQISDRFSKINAVRTTNFHIFLYFSLEILKMNRIAMTSRRYLSTLITSESLMSSRQASSHRPFQLLDASWQMPNASSIPCKDAFALSHIPGARFFDVDEIAERGPLPHMVSALKWSVIMFDLIVRSDASVHLLAIPHAPIEYSV